MKDAKKTIRRAGMRSGEVHAVEDLTLETVQAAELMVHAGLADDAMRLAVINAAAALLGITRMHDLDAALAAFADVARKNADANRRTDA